MVLYVFILWDNQKKCYFIDVNIEVYYDKKFSHKTYFNDIVYYYELYGKYCDLENGEYFCSLKKLKKNIEKNIYTFDSRCECDDDLRYSGLCECDADEKKKDEYIVYQIINLRNLKTYVGTTDKTLLSVSLDHYILEDNEKISKLIKKYGLYDFKFEIIERFDNISEKKLMNKKLKYIKLFDSDNNGYN